MELDDFDRLASEHQDALTRRLLAAGLPTAGVLPAFEVALVGMRLGVAGWNPHPPLAPEERESVMNLLSDTLSTVVEGAIGEVVTQRDRAAGRVLADLSAWHRKRAALKIRPTPEQAAAMSDRPAEDYDTMEIEQLPDGRFRAHYRIKPSPPERRGTGVIDWTRRGLEEAAKERGE